MDNSQESSLTEKQRHWLEHLRACDASGQGIAAHAAAHGLDARAMYAGKKIWSKEVYYRVPAGAASSEYR